MRRPIKVIPCESMPLGSVITERSLRDPPRGLVGSRVLGLDRGAMNPTGVQVVGGPSPRFCLYEEWKMGRIITQGLRGSPRGRGATSSGAR